MKFILAINPTVSNHYFCSKMSECDIRIVALFTCKSLPEYSKDSLNSKYYYKLIPSKENLELDIANIQYHIPNDDLVCGIIGTEINYTYAETLLSYLFPNNSNKPISSDLRFKKFEMCEKISLSELSSSKQMKINLNNSLENNLELISSYFHIRDYPLIAKPNHGSAASMGVEFCNSLTELKSYILKNNCGLFYNAEEIIIQENLKGTEYFVDSFSTNGSHHFSSVFKYSKDIINGKIISRYKDILSDDDLLSIKVKNYVTQCLSILDYKFGFAHTEIILTNDGFKLVEVNPRVSGAQGTSQYISKLKHNIDQFDLLLEFIFNEKKIRHCSDKHYRCIHLYNRKFQYKKFSCLPFVKLNSFKDIKVLQESGTAKNSGSLIDTIALIVLEHSSMRQIEKDTLEILKIEENGNFIEG